jgi:hypothetical protein
LLCLHITQRVEGVESKLVKPMADGSLVMLPWNKLGDRLPDFSYCGYKNGGVKLPDVPTLVTLKPSGAEDELRGCGGKHTHLNEVSQIDGASSLGASSLGASASMLSSDVLCCRPEWEGIEGGRASCSLGWVR